jgi:hypothetical protein
MKKLNFSAHVMNVFSEMETNYDEVKNLMFDLAMGNEIYDEESGRVVPKAEAETKLRGICQKIFGVNENSSKRELKRAYREHGRDFFDIIEEVIDVVISHGFKDNEFFNNFVDYRNIALGDAYEFYMEKEVILSIAKVGTSHHDYILQRLGKGETLTIPYQRYGAAVGADINMYMIGRESWSNLTSAIARAFTVQIQQEIYAELLSAANKIPAAVRSGFVGSGVLSATTKDAFDAILENVQTANESNIVILGTKTALKKLNALSDVNWRAQSLKEDVSHSGRMGDYEGTVLMEIPQRFTSETNLTPLVDNTKLWILPADQTDKFIKMVDVGETEIDEITEKGEEHGRWDDIMKYEVQRSYGIATQLGRYFGQWTLTTA